MKNINRDVSVPGYSHPKCYASPLKNCSVRLSEEHYLTKAILKLLIKSLEPHYPILGVNHMTIDANGNPILKKDHRQRDPVKAEVLCAHHNNKLSQFDQVGIDIAKALIATDERPYTCSAKYIIKGENFERYILKSICGHITDSANKASNNVPIKSVPFEWLDILFSNKPVPINTGLYFQPIHHGHTLEQKVQALAHTSDPHTATGGYRLMFGWMFFVLLESGRGEIETDPKPIFKPSRIIFKKDGFEREIAFSWDQKPAKEEVFVITVR